jgi:formylglycine-generating enzyme required for sulfatase activity
MLKNLIRFILLTSLFLVAVIALPQDKTSVPSNYIETACRINMQMVFVKGGTFKMGSNDGAGDEKPVHQVKLNDFCIGKYEVTQRQWQYVMGKNPSFFKDCEDCPVEQVSWYDVQQFIRKLNRKSGRNYRLPTEAEWEYAARGGSKSRGYVFSGSDTLGNVAWYNDNSGSKTHLVGQKHPDELGLNDMSGNVMEWCSDWYGHYSPASQVNPKGPREGDYKVYRGGGWGYVPRSCRPSARDRSSPSSHSFNLGFRLAIEAE